MRLKDYILKHTLEYPSLYLAHSYEESRLLVLEQCFLVLGNGLEWAHTKKPEQGGYMVSPRQRKYKGDWTRTFDLPYGKQTYPEIDWADVIQQGLKQKHEFRFRKMSDHRPYPFAKEYWPFAEIKPELIQADWRQGMIDIKKWALSFFEDKPRFDADKYFGPHPKELKEYYQKNHPNKTWVETLADYGIKGADIQENDWETLANGRAEKGRLKYVTDLKEAIQVLEQLNERKD